jgi:tyrosyl-tRNA synthetase
LVCFCVQIGGTTGVVGDPSGRSKEREGLSTELLERNKVALKDSLERIFRNGQDETVAAQLPLK